MLSSKCQDPLVLLLQIVDADVESPAMKRAYKISLWWAFGLSAGTFVIWPLLTLPAGGTWSLGYFTFWIILSIVWGLVAGAAQPQPAACLRPFSNVLKLYLCCYSFFQSSSTIAGALSRNLYEANACTNKGRIKLGMCTSALPMDQSRCHACVQSLLACPICVM